MNYYGSQRRKRVFISFDFDNDKFLRDSLVGQAKHNNTPFELEDWSVKEPWDQRTWKDECLTKIKKCDLVIVMVGEKTKSCSGVKAEIKMANEAGVPVYGIEGYKDKSCPQPEGLRGYYVWTWENVKYLVDNA